MTTLLVRGSGALVLALPVSLAAAILALIVVFRYIQTIQRSSDGGSAYTVTKDNLGVIPSLSAVGALLTGLCPRRPSVSSGIAIGDPNTRLIAASVVKLHLGAAQGCL